MCISLFHYAVLEEYYLGGLIFGYCNPISDLSIVVYILYCVLGTWGPQIMQNDLFEQGLLWTSSPAITYLTTFYYITNTLMIGNIFFCIYKIMKYKRHEGKGKNAKFCTVLFQIIFYVITVLAVNSLAYAGEEPLIEMKSPGSWGTFWIILL